MQTFTVTFTIDDEIGDVADLPPRTPCTQTRMRRLKEGDCLSLGIFFAEMAANQLKHLNANLQRLRALWWTSCGGAFITADQSGTCSAPVSKQLRQVPPEWYPGVRYGRSSAA